VGAFADQAPQFDNQLLGEFSHVFGHYIPGIHVVAYSNIRKDLATGTQHLAPHCFGPAPQEEPAEKIAEPMSALNVQQGG